MEAVITGVEILSFAASCWCLPGDYVSSLKLPKPKK